GFPEIKTPSSNPPTGEVAPVKDAIGRPFSIEPSTSITPTNDLDKLATARVTDISPTIEDVEIIAVTLERGVYAGQPETLIFKMTREKAQELGIRDVGQEFKVKFWLPPVTPPPPKVALESTPPPPLVEEDGEPTAKMRRNGLGADDATPLRELDTDEATPLREFLADEDMPPTVKSTRLNQLMALELKLKDLRTMLEANQALKTQADELTIVLKNDPKSIDIEYFSYVKGLKPHADDISVKLRFKDGKMVIAAEHLDSLPLETQQMIRKVLTE
ncbi:MAG: hypothetical protein JNK65_08325, partial [Deltaproteobacteria bacterium]|nr:hypothetical protein [Deltaproteobacteria bacterium]